MHQSAIFPLDLYNFECTYIADSCHLLKSYILTTFFRERRDDWDKFVKTLEGT